MPNIFSVVTGYATRTHSTKNRAYCLLAWSSPMCLSISRGKAGEFFYQGCQQMSGLLADSSQIKPLSNLVNYDNVKGLTHHNGELSKGRSPPPLDLHPSRPDHVLQVLQSVVRTEGLSEGLGSLWTDGVFS